MSCLKISWVKGKEKGRKGRKAPPPPIDEGVNWYLLLIKVCLLFVVVIFTWNKCLLENNVSLTNIFQSMLLTSTGVQSFYQKFVIKVFRCEALLWTFMSFRHSLSHWRLLFALYHKITGRELVLCEKNVSMFDISICDTVSVCPSLSQTVTGLTLITFWLQNTQEYTKLQKI